MAINNTSNKGSNQGNHQGNQNQHTQQNTQTPPPAVPAQNFFGMKDAWSPTRTSTNEIEALLTHGNAYLKAHEQVFSNGGAFKWALINVPSDASGAQLDTAVLVLTVVVTKNGSTNKRSLSTLVYVPGTNVLPPQSPVVGNMRYKFASIPKDMEAVPGYLDNIKAGIKSSVPESAELNFIEISGSVTIPQHYSMDEGAVQRLMQHMMTNTHSIYRTYYAAGMPFILTDSFVNEQKLIVDGDLHPNDVYDLLNNPVRADISVKIGIGMRHSGHNNAEVNALANSSSRNLATIHAYADPIFSKTQLDNGRLARNDYARGTRDTIETQVYNLGLHITEIAVPEYNTLEINLLMIAQLAHLMRERVGFEMLRPTQESISIRNHNMWRYDLDDPMYLEEMKAMPSDAEWAKYTDTFFKLNAIDVFLHLDQSGLFSPINNIFLQATNSYDAATQTAALQMIEIACNNITNNQFGTLAGIDASGNRVENNWFGNSTNRVLTGGFYVDHKTGKRKDSRELLNHFAAITRFGKIGYDSQDMTDLINFDDVLYTGARNDVERLQAQEIFLNEMSGGTHKTTTRHSLVRINPAFIVKLIDAIGMTKLAIDVNLVDHEATIRQSYQSEYQPIAYGGYGYRR